MKKQPKKTKSKHKWLRKELSKLGKIPDAELARRIGIRTAVVSRKRSSMEIEPLSTSQRLNWTKENLALLGTRTDREVAEIMNASPGRVTIKRLSLGIESYAISSNSWHTWTDEEIAMLGTDHDPAVAEKIGISTRSVSLKRRQLGIRSFLKRKAVIRPRRYLSDWKAKETALLGTMTDKDLAARLNLSPSAVRLKRLSLGIAPFRKRAASTGIWTPAVMARIIKEPSAALARELGVSRQRVHQKRKELLER
ncbi:MAG: hypothetical protein NWT08_03690 [Akkermansiaceae bacterium]|nr:hypothetical protein [Akkermansiaceae bacterium]